jgi:hypothetical protein
MYSLSEQWTHILKDIGIEHWSYLTVGTQNKNGAQYSLLKDFSSLMLYNYFHISISTLH